MTESFINSAPTLSQCEKCQGWVLECYVAGFLTRVEPNPLNFAEELIARAKGLRIYQTFGTSQVCLVRRKLWHIEKADPRAKVLATHDCQSPTYFEPSPLFEKPAISKSEGIPF